MSHLDEGTLHALLDGELGDHEVREIQAHLGSCSACGTRLQSVKDVLTESDRLVATLQFPGTPRPPAALDAEPAAAPRERAVASEADVPVPGQPSPAARPPRRLELDPVYHEAPPVLLVPEDSNWLERRRRMVLAMRWAALVLVAVGAGYLASEIRRTGGVAAVAPAPRAEVVPEESLPAAVLSQEEATGGGDGTPPAARKDEAPAAAEPKQTPAPARAERRPATPPPVESEPVEEADQIVRDALQRDAPAEAEPEAVAPNVREEAAEALAELDRQRRRERAAAATAELSRRTAQAGNEAAATGAAGVVAPAAALPAPAPRTLEQRSGIYLRIGLDEAARQLGRPVHVLEGMQQQFMGLAQGSGSPGADPARPVVRVVYQDPQGRMILLDQQRIRPGQSWGSGDTRWVIGEIGVALGGDPGPAILRNLRPRVR